jgi:glyoxylase-like metal-dependent hydrolase (beta-lactamase superfamily II)
MAQHSFDNFRVERFYLGCLAHASYCVYSPSSKAAFIVDPRRDVAPYLSFLGAHDLTLKAVLLTHVHADFVAGHLDLARLGGNVPVHVGASNWLQVRHNYPRLADGFTADLSDVVPQSARTALLGTHIRAHDVERGG